MRNASRQAVSGREGQERRRRNQEEGSGGDGVGGDSEREVSVSVWRWSGSCARRRDTARAAERRSGSSASVWDGRSRRSRSDANRSARVTDEASSASSDVSCGGDWGATAGAVGGDDGAGMGARRELLRPEATILGKRARAPRVVGRWWWFFAGFGELDDSGGDGDRWEWEQWTGLGALWTLDSGVREPSSLGQAEAE
ncbi:hypothetical protein BDA96_06G260300 [Sorghum bicolor]|uniref:Uncharacterized protein n=1 Tax=Sorghum bicolor TaxID=4558 RepID=A0A921QU63_SORBI|nr:hypothetical protein BDA96_06G260300 [Sorghum bicolor]